MSINFWNGLRRRVSRDRVTARAQSAHEAAQRVVVGPNEIAGGSPFKPKHDRGVIGAAGVAMVAASHGHSARVEAGWAVALAELPGSLRAMVHTAQAELTATEAELAAVYAGLVAHERANPGLADNATWVYRHVALTNSVAGVEALIAQRRATLSGLYGNAALLLDRTLRQRSQRADRHLAAAAASRDAAIAAARLAYGAAVQAHAAVGAVWAAVREDDRHALARRLGGARAAPPPVRSRFAQGEAHRELGALLAIEASASPAPRESARSRWAQLLDSLSPADDA